MVAFGLIKWILNTASLWILNIYMQGLQEKKPHMLKCSVEREVTSELNMCLQPLL